MNVIYTELKELFVSALIDIIEKNSEKISMFDKPYHRKNKINVYGVSLEISPWYGYFYLELIPSDKTNEAQFCSDFGFQIGESEEEITDLQKNAKDHMVQLYERKLKESNKYQHTNLGHLIFYSAAGALLDKRFTEKLIEHDIPAELPVNNQFHTFTYHVYNRDETLKMNYCEHHMLSSILSVFDT